MIVPILAIASILFGGFLLYAACRNVFGIKVEPEEEQDIDPETGEEVLSGEVVENQQLQS